MNDKTVLLEKLRRLAAPGSGATDGERKAALSAIERITGKPEAPSTIVVPEYSRAEIGDILSQVTEQLTFCASELTKAAQNLANAFGEVFSNMEERRLE